MTSKSRENVFIKILLLAVAGSFMYALSSGIRNNYGIMLNSIVKTSGISFASVSFVLAIGQFSYGLFQPVFGIVASKRGNMIVLITGAVLMIAGMLLTPISKSVLSLTLSLGIIIPAGTAALAFGLIMAALGETLPQNAVHTVSGIVNASSGIGNTIMSPLLSSMIISGGLAYTMNVFAIPIAMIIPISFLICRKSESYRNTKSNKVEKISTKSVFKEAFKTKNYLFLMIGFFTCGFHMAIITNHLPNEFLSLGFTQENTAYAFSVYGLTTIAGSVLSGVLCGKIKMKNVLGFYYAMRPITIVMFFFLPKNIFTICLYAGLLGFSGAATVPPVSGLITKLYGKVTMPILFGFVFLIHQIGGFFGAWLSGVFFESFGTYTIVWVLSIAFSTIAALVSFMIKEEN